jgi:cytochrome c-type biogenesis protein CcmH/NrfF
VTERLGKTRLWQGVIVCVLAVVMLGAGGVDSSVRYGRIGHNLMCVCGCGQVLLECNHVGCPDSSRMIGELQDQIAGPNGQGADALVLNWFVAKYGATVLAAPIRGGFDIVAWIIPLTLFVGALFGTALLVKVWSDRRRVAAGPAGLNVDVPMNDALREKIRRETEW